MATKSVSFLTLHTDFALRLEEFGHQIGPVFDLTIWIFPLDSLATRSVPFLTLPYGFFPWTVWPPDLSRFWPYHMDFSLGQFGHQICPVFDLTIWIFPLDSLATRSVPFLTLPYGFCPWTVWPPDQSRFWPYHMDLSLGEFGHQISPVFDFTICIFPLESLATRSVPFLTLPYGSFPWTVWPPDPSRFWPVVRARRGRHFLWRRRRSLPWRLRSGTPSLYPTSTADCLRKRRLEITILCQEKTITNQ